MSRPRLATAALAAGLLVGAAARDALRPVIGIEHFGAGPAGAAEPYLRP